MKSRMAAFWFVVSLALGGFLAVQWRQHRQQQVKMDDLQLQVEKLAQESRGAASKVQELEKERGTMQRQLAAAQDQAARTSAAADDLLTKDTPTITPKATASNASGGKDGGGPGNFFANLLKDPEARKAMREQQRMGLNMIYGSLFKQLQLSPEQEQIKGPSARSADGEYVPGWRFNGRRRRSGSSDEENRRRTKAAAGTNQGVAW
jgi:hypothetical protein